MFQQIEKVGSGLYRFSPGLQVTLAGGVTRRAIAGADDPITYVMETLMKPEVWANVDVAGRTAVAVGSRNSRSAQAR